MIITTYAEYKKRLSELENKSLKSMSSKEIEASLISLVKNLECHKGELANAVTCETGKPIKYSIWEVERSIDLIYSFISYFYAYQNICGIIPNKAYGSWRTIRKPIGIVIGFTPFSSPFSSFLHKMIASIIHRNVFFCKPSSRAMKSSLRLYEVICDSFSQKLTEFISVITIPDSSLSELLAGELFDCILFTGKSSTARHIKTLIGRKKGAFEAGSMATSYVAKSADLLNAAKEIAKSSFSQSGLRCIATKNVFICEDVYCDFVDLLKQEIQKFKVGDCFDIEVDISYIMFEDLRQELQLAIDELQYNGYEILLGGKFENNILYPTLISDSNSGFNSLTELYGPVLVVHKIKSYEAIPIEYKKRSSLNSAIFSNDYLEIENWIYSNDFSGGLYVNHNTATRFDHLPFGGFFDENEGKEGIVELEKLLTKEQIIV